MRVRAVTRNLLGVLAVTAGLLVLPATTAHATPTGCTATPGVPTQWDVSATCTGGTGTVTAWAECSDGSTGDTYFAHGAAVGVGGTSKAHCWAHAMTGVSDWWYTTTG